MAEIPRSDGTEMMIFHQGSLRHLETEQPLEISLLHLPTKTSRLAAHHSLLSLI